MAISELSITVVSDRGQIALAGVGQNHDNRLPRELGLAGETIRHRDRGAARNPA